MNAHKRPFVGVFQDSFRGKWFICQLLTEKCPAFLKNLRKLTFQIPPRKAWRDRAQADNRKVHARPFFFFFITLKPRVE